MFFFQNPSKTDSVLPRLKVQGHYTRMTNYIFGYGIPNPGWRRDPINYINIYILLNTWGPFMSLVFWVAKKFWVATKKPRLGGLTLQN